MDKTLFAGTGVALITPFTQDEVDYQALSRLIDWQIDSGTDALVVLGTTGEPCTMTEDERERVIAFVVERTAGRVPVIAGTGANVTKDAIERSVRAQRQGADALLMVTPYYNKTTQAGLIAHFTTVADQVALPIILYNVPSRTGLNLLPETAAELTRHPNIRGVKEASANIEQITELARLCGERIALYSGNDDHVLPVLALGGQGVISVAANIVPEMAAALTHRYFEGDIESSRRVQFQMNPLVKSLFSEVNPIPVKTALMLMGRCDGSMRLPLVPMSEKGRMALEQILHVYGVL